MDPNMDAEAAIALHGVTKRFGGLAVCSDISFAVPPGARLALIGPNGAGKTTLFNLISGVFGIDGGSIALHGQPIHDLPPRHRVRAGLSRTFQNIRLMPHLSVIENIMLGQHARASKLGALLSPLAWQRDSVWRAQALEQMRRAGIDIDPDAAVTGLPYGLRKRIEVVRALMSRPRVLMLDEPAAGLNPRETAELSAFLKSVAWDGLTMLVVEHDMSFVHDLCDRTVVLNFGRLIYDGPTHRVQDDQQVREAYLGTRRVVAKVAGRVA
jgi:branched-chain amino acid transport system ATP-binding protein